MKEHSKAKECRVTGVIGLHPADELRLISHTIRDEMTEARWAGGPSAADEMRQDGE